MLAKRFSTANIDNVFKTIETGNLKFSNLDYFRNYKNEERKKRGQKGNDRDEDNNREDPQDG